MVLAWTTTDTGPREVCAGMLDVMWLLRLFVQQNTLITFFSASSLFSSQICKLSIVADDTRSFALFGLR
jgi:hypothetical protein